MKKDKFNIDEATLSVDLNDATQAVKDSRFKDALNLLKTILKENPNHIDSLYLAAVSARYLKQFDESKQYICLLYTSPSPRDRTRSRMPSSA